MKLFLKLTKPLNHFFFFTLCAGEFYFSPTSSETVMLQQVQTIAHSPSVHLWWITGIQEEGDGMWMDYKHLTPV